MLGTLSHHRDSGFCLRQWVGLTVLKTTIHNYHCMGWWSRNCPEPVGLLSKWYDLSISTNHSDVGPTFTHHWVKVLCLLGRYHVLLPQQCTVGSKLSLAQMYVLQLLLTGRLQSLTITYVLQPSHFGLKGNSSQVNEISATIKFSRHQDSVHNDLEASLIVVAFYV